MKRFLKLVFILTISSVGILTLFFSIRQSLYDSKHTLTVTHYEITDFKLETPLTLVQLTDLHGSQFGSENEQLVELIRTEAPDLIAMTGDMFNMDADTQEIERLCQLVSRLHEIAPVIYSLGNHEDAYIDAFGGEVLSRLESAGAIVLDFDYTELSLSGQEFRIGGAYGYLLDPKFRETSEQTFMRDYLNTTHPTILLSHLSEGLLLYEGMNAWDVDLVLSGHTHGGQIRLPLIGGLYSPETGWFPKYTKGIFSMAESTLVLSAGLGTSGDIPRFGNLPEVVVVKLS